MSYFQYKIIQDNGEVKTVLTDLPFDNEKAVYSYLERLGKTIVTLKKINIIVAFFLTFITFWSQARITQTDTQEYLRNISLMLKAGIPLLIALEEAEVNDEGDNPALVIVSNDMQMSIQAGLSFTEALGLYPKIFSKPVRYLARIGEETGRLDKTLLNAANHLDKISRIQVDVQKAMIYPVMVFATTMGAVIFWMYYVVPNLLGLFKNMQVELPAVTKLLLAMSDFVSQHIITMLIMIAVVIFSVVMLIKHNNHVRYLFHRLLLKLPIAKKLVRAANLAFIFEYLSLLIESGIDVITSVKILSDSIENEVYRRKFKSIESGLLLGNSIEHEFSALAIFPRYVVRMVKAGEQSGSLGEQFSYIAEHYQIKLNDTIDNLSELIKPLAILIVGGIFIFILVALFLPIYDLIGSVNTVGRY
jgi:general secretion pathway protein F/type IV pilus assembly protein PilC